MRHYNYSNAVPRGGVLWSETKPSIPHLSFDVFISSAFHAVGVPLVTRLRVLSLRGDFN